MNSHLVTRRGVLIAGAGGLAATAGPARSSAPEPTLSEAMRRRQSTRTFADRPVPTELVAALAWAAQGVNRPETGLRTAPSWHGAADTRLRVCGKAGVAVYDPATDGLSVERQDDVRARLSPQPFVATAPVVLVYTSDLARMPEAPEDQIIQFAHVDAGIVAQNVYLFCAAQGLGTCLVGGIDAGGLSDALHLAASERPLFVQPVGWPR